ncbi:MAG TPA: porin [Verrucomicrobiae bacterium]|jgi:phosphate-selective porin OprO/OprP|nr:porin [Verrucomicrobiae bacterium]
MRLSKITAGLLLASPAYLLAADQAPTMEQLLDRIKDLEQQVKVLSRNHELEEEAKAEKSKTTPTVVLGSNGLEVRSADTNFTMRIHAHIQADGRFYPNNTSTTDDTFLMRRVRPMIDGTLFSKLDYRLMLDFGSGLTATPSNIGFVQEAYFNARLLPEFQIQAGKMKEPVGLERLMSDVDYLFTERSYPTQLVPNRDVGVQVQGTFNEGLLTYAVGVFNGVTDGNSGDVDAGDDDKDIAARVFAQPFLKTGIEPLQKLGVGLAGTYGHHGGPLRGYTSPGQQPIFNYYAGTGTNAVTAADGNISRLAPQAYYYYGPFGLLAEYTISASDATRNGGGVKPQSKRLQHTAWQVAGSYFLTGEENGFKNPTPRKPVDFHGGGWGAWELVARISGLKLDPDTFPTFADPKVNASEAFSYGAGVNWHLNKNFKLTLDYEHTNFKGGAFNPILAQDEDVIMTRAQISF